MVKLPPVPDYRARTKPALAAAALGGALAGVMYAGTLLPGLDLGDTASFQTVVNLPLLVPRHAYPLYFALGKLCVSLLGGEPAHAMNVLSAVAGAAAVAAFAWWAFALTARPMAAFSSALLFASSYTFWSQAVIAEVYTLEAFFIGLVFIAAIAWWRTPTTARLAWLYAIYALSFGNHLSMILLAPGLTWLLWSGRPRAALDPFSPKGIAVAAAIAAAGALQYAWNFSGLWTLSAPRPPLTELLSTFWFDVTKSDWRATLVGTVPVAQWLNRLSMYWWDLQQQFGVWGIAIAIFGLVAIVRASFSVAVGLLLAYLVTFGFAFIYNVGDTHVFLLPSHQLVAVFAAVGAGALLTAAERFARMWRWTLVAALLAIPAWRIADTWPAVDRSADRRAEQYADSALVGLSPAATVYVGDLNWQTQNAVGYELAVRRPELPLVYANQVLWHFPDFVRRNHELGRDIVLTAPAAEVVRSAYGPLFRLDPDMRGTARPLSSLTALSPGTPYALVVMTPLPEVSYDADDVARAARTLAGIRLPRARYVMVAGLAGSPPIVNAAGNYPSRAAGRIAGHRFDIRIESWLPADTMRRAGFGHVIVDGRHVLTAERGATLGIFDLNGRLVDSTNQGGSFAVQPRYVIPVLR